MPTIIKLRRDTAANWTSSNPILALGEAGVDTTNNQIRIGDGTSTWSLLTAIGGGAAELDGLADVSVVGSATGYVLQDDGDGTYSMVAANTVVSGALDNITTVKSATAQDLVLGSFDNPTQMTLVAGGGISTSFPLTCVDSFTASGTATFDQAVTMHQNVLFNNESRTQRDSNITYAGNIQGIVQPLYATNGSFQVLTVLNNVTELQAVGETTTAGDKGRIIIKVNANDTVTVAANYTGNWIWEGGAAPAAFPAAQQVYNQHLIIDWVNIDGTTILGSHFLAN